MQRVYLSVYKRICCFLIKIWILLKKLIITFFKLILNEENYDINLWNKDPINNKLWWYPFLITENISLPALVYLFKECGINLHGMSTTKRHKLSPLEENLSNFLYITDLSLNIENSSLCYNDKIFSNNNLDFNLYNEIYDIQNTNVIKLNKLDTKIEKLKNYRDSTLNLQKNYYWISKLVICKKVIEI